MANLKPYGKMTVMNNIQVGDIVYRKATGGTLRVQRLDRSQIGLVVDKHKGFEDDSTKLNSTTVPTGSGFMKTIYIRSLVPIRRTNDL